MSKIKCLTDVITTKVQEQVAGNVKGRLLLDRPLTPEEVKQWDDILNALGYLAVSGQAVDVVGFLVATCIAASVNPVFIEQVGSKTLEKSIDATMKKYLAELPEGTKH